MSKEIYMKQVDGDGWTYYIDSFIAWFPMYCQGRLCWLSRVWETWPEDKNGKLILVEDVMPSMVGTPHGKHEMYHTYWPYDPRMS